MTALSLPFKPFSWLRRNRAAPPRPLLPAYRHDSALRRNRKKLGWALFLFVIIYTMAFQLFGRFAVVQFLWPYFLLFLMVIWALPERGSAPAAALRFLFFGFLTALLVWPNYLALALPGMPWITALRTFGFPMALVFLVCLSVSEQFRSEMKAVLSASPAVTKLMIALAAVLAFSVLISPAIVGSANSLVAMLVNLIGAFFIACHIFMRPGTGMKLVYLLWLAIVVTAIIVIWEVRDSQVPWAGHIPDFLKIEDENVQRVLAGSARAATGIYRAQAKYTTSLSLAEFLGLSAPFILHLAMTARQIWLRPLAWITLPVMFWMIVKTDSRLGAVGFFMTLMLYLLAWSGQRWYRDRRSIFGPAITLSYPLIFAMFIAATLIVGRLRNAVWGTGAHAASNNAREVQWEIGIPKIAQRPWGHGLGQSGEALGYANQRGTVTVDSYYLTMLLDTGLVGFLIFFAIPVWLIVRAGKVLNRAVTQEERLLTPIAITLANFIIIKSVLSQTEGHPLVFIVMGLGMALIYRVSQRDESNSDSNRVGAGGGINER